MTDFKMPAGFQPSPDDYVRQELLIAKLEARHQRTIDALACRIDAYDSDLSALRARQQELEPLLDYVQHKPNCPALPTNYGRYTLKGRVRRECTCGLDALLTPRPSVKEQP